MLRVAGRTDGFGQLPPAESDFLADAAQVCRGDLQVRRQLFERDVLQEVGELLQQMDVALLCRLTVEVQKAVVGLAEQSVGYGMMQVGMFPEQFLYDAPAANEDFRIRRGYDVRHGRSLHHQVQVVAHRRIAERKTGDVRVPVRIGHGVFEISPCDEAPHASRGFSLAQEVLSFLI